MKKIFGFLAALSWFVTSLIAQPYFCTATIQQDPLSPFLSWNVPICGWGQNYSVTYIVDGNKLMFALVDHADFHAIHPLTPSSPLCAIYRAQINLPNYITSFQVSDIYVLDDYVFFCGELCDNNLNSTFPMWGYFDVNDFFSTSLSITVCTLSNGTSSAPKSLEKMVVYKIGNQYDVVTYGHKDATPIVVEVTDALSLPSFSNCNVANLLCPPLMNVTIDDIVLTDSYVVFVTKYNNGRIGYSRGLRGSVVTDLFSEANRWVNLNQEANGLIAGVALPDDQFAMAYVHVDATGSKLTRLRVFEIATDKNLRAYEFSKLEKEDPVKMVYLHKAGTVELMQPIQDSMDYIRLDPFATTPYYTVMFVPGGRMYSNMSKMDGQRFISTSGNQYYLQDRQALSPPSAVACPDRTDYYVNVIPELTVSNLMNNGKWDNSTTLISLTATPIKKDYLTIDCYSFEQKTKIKQ
ncbi:MAG: hypothetical protein K6E96_09440 [Bacteroidales bacterium]|nr:hypothetical protein [Bacteroidales bacterium]